MTGNYSEKARAAFLALIMVTSVFAGTMALAGSAAAAVAANGGIQTQQPVQPSESTTIQVDTTGTATSADVIVGIDADGDNTIQSDEVVTVGTSSGSSSDTFSFNPNSATGIDTNTDGSFTVAVIEDTSASNTDTNDDMSPYDVSSAGATDTLDVDGVAPTLQKAEKTGPTTYTLTFSETVYAASGQSGSFSGTAGDDIGYTNNNGQDASAGFSSVSGSGSSTVTVDMGESITSSDLGTDEIYAVAGNVYDAADNTAPSNAVVVQAQELAGGTDNGVQFEVGSNSNTNVVAGNATEVIPEIKLRDDAADSDAAFAGETTITLPDGMTVNTSASSLSTTSVITSSNDGVSINGVSVSSDNKDIVLEHSGTSVNGETIRLKSGALVVEIDGTEIKTDGGSTTALPLKVNSFEGDSRFDGAFQVGQLNPQESLSGSISVNGNGQSLAGGDTFSIDDVDANEIGAGTDIELTLNDGVTFDSRISGDDITSTVAGLDVDSDGTDELNASDVTINGDTMTIGVSDEIDSDDSTITFDAGFDQALSVDASASNTPESEIAAGDVLFISTDSEAVVADETIAADALSGTTSIDVAADSSQSITDANNIVPVSSFDGTENSRGTVASSSDTDFASDENSITLTADSSLNNISPGDLLAISSDGDASASDTFVVALESASGSTDTIAVTGASGTSFSSGDNIIEVNTDFSTGTDTNIDTSGSSTIYSSDPIRFNTTGTASDSDINMTVEPSAPSVSPFQISDDSGSAPLTDALTVNAPELSLSSSTTLAVGDSSQSPTGNLNVDLTSAGVQGGSVLEFTVNNSDVTFDTSDSVSASDLEGTGDLTNGDVDSVEVTENAITVTLADDAGTISGSSPGIQIAAADFSHNVSAAAEAGATVQYNLTIDDVVKRQATSTFLTLQTPSISSPVSGSVGVGETEQSVGAADMTIDDGSITDSASTPFTSGSNSVANNEQVQTTGSAGSSDAITTGQIIQIDSKLVIAGEGVSGGSSPSDDELLVYADAGKSLASGSNIETIGTLGAAEASTTALDTSGNSQSIPSNSNTATLTFGQSEGASGDIVVGDALVLSEGDTNVDSSDARVVVVEDTSGGDDTVTVAGVPGTTLDSGTAANVLVVKQGGIGSVSQTGDLAMTSGQQTVDTLENSGTVTITANRSGVTFNTQVDKTAIIGGSGGGIEQHTDASDSITVTENELQIEVTDADGLSNAESLDINFDGANLLNVSTDVEDGSEVHFNATTTPGDGEISVGQTATTVTLNRPSTQLGGAESVYRDDDGLSGLQLSNALTVSSTEIGDLTAGNDDDGATGNGDGLGWVNVTINGTGVTFDESVDPGTATMIDSTTDIEVRGGNEDNIQISADELAIPIELTDGAVSDGVADESIQINFDGEGLLNVSDSVANGTSFQFSATTTPDNRSGSFSHVSSSASNLLTIETAEPDAIYGDYDVTTDSGGDDNGPNSDYGTTGSLEADATADGTSVSVGSNVYSSVWVENTSMPTNSDVANAFGGESVSLEIVETPDGATGQSLNVTSGTTDSSGEFGYRFTAGDATGTYIVNATTENGQGVNVTYDVSAGKAATLNVTNIDNALIESGSTTQETEVAAIKVNVEDSGGNLVESRNVDVALDLTGDADLYTSGGTASGLAEEITSSGAPSGSDVTDTDGDGRFNYEQNTGSNTGDANKGDFYIFLTDGTAEDVDVTLTPESAGSGVNAISPDDDTTTFFDRPDSTAVSLNETSLLVSETAQVTAEAQTADGTTIEVPRLTVDSITSTNTTVATISNADAQTNGTGVATADVTTQDFGTTLVNASIAGNEGTAVELTSSQPTLAVDTNVSTVTIDEETTVEANVTFANNATAAEGATVNVTGAGVSVADQTTDADGLVTFSATATESGTITVNATKDGADMGQTTISTQEPANLSTSYDVEPTTVATGEEVTITATVENTGDVSGSTDVTFYADGMELSNETVTVDAGSSETANASTTFDTTGTHNVSVNDLDATNITVEEPAEANFTTTYTVDNTTVTTGEEVTITATVENTGDASGSTTVEFYADGSEISNTSVTVDAGNTSTATETATFDTAGTHNVSVNDLDATDITVENETTGLPEDPGFQDVLDVISAFNDGEQFNGVDVGFQDVLDVISAFNQG